MRHLYAQAVMSAFSFQFDSDGPFLAVGAGAGMSSWQVGSVPNAAPIATGTMTGTSEMNGTVDVGYLALTNEQSGLAVDVQSDTGGETPSDFYFDTGAGELAAAAVFLQSFFVQFPNSNPQDFPIPYLLNLAIGAYYLILNFPAPGSIQFSSNKYLYGQAEIGNVQVKGFTAANMVANYLIVAINGVQRQFQSSYRLDRDFHAGIRHRT